MNTALQALYPQELTDRTETVTEIVTGILNQSIAPMLTMIMKQQEQQAIMMQGMAETISAQATMIQELQRQVSYSIPLTASQEKQLKEAIHRQAETLLTRYGCTSKKAVNKLASVIRKDIKGKFGVGSLKDISKPEWVVAMDAVRRWMDVRKVAECGREG